MRYRSLDGRAYEADSLEALALSLWQTKFMPEPTIKAWMEGSAERARVYSGAEIRTDTPDHHIQDLITHGFLTPDEGGQDDPA